jgi:hypothetical protein
MTSSLTRPAHPLRTRLVERFCECPGRTMCKREVYADYTAYCRANGHEPTNPSSFGKLVHSVTTPPLLAFFYFSFPLFPKASHHGVPLLWVGLGLRCTTAG